MYLRKWSAGDDQRKRGRDGGRLTGQNLTGQRSGRGTGVEGGAIARKRLRFGSTMRAYDQGVMARPAKSSIKSGREDKEMHFLEKGGKGEKGDKRGAKPHGEERFRRLGRTVKASGCLEFSADKVGGFKRSHLPQ